MNDTRTPTDSLECPTEGCPGKVATRTSDRLSSGEIRRFRICKCCGREEIAIVRPETVIVIRTAKDGVYTNQTG